MKGFTCPLQFFSVHTVTLYFSLSSSLQVLCGHPSDHLRQWPGDELGSSRTLSCMLPALVSHFAKITFEHINDFRTWTFPSGWVPNKLDVEFVIKYEWQPMQFLTASTPWRLFTSLFLSPKTELYCWGQLPCGFTWAVQVHQQILWSSEYTESTKTWWLGCTRWCAVVLMHLNYMYNRWTSSHL